MNEWLRSSGGPRLLSCTNRSAAGRRSTSLDCLEVLGNPSLKRSHPGGAEFGGENERKEKKKQKPTLNLRDLWRNIALTSNSPSDNGFGRKKKKKKQPVRSEGECRSYTGMEDCVTLAHSTVAQHLQSQHGRSAPQVHFHLQKSGRAGQHSPMFGYRGPPLLRK